MIKTILKFAFAGALLTWLFKRGEIDFLLIVKAFDYPKFLALGIIFAIIDLLFCAFRYKLILQTKTKEKISYIEVIKVSWIGSFFNILLPGSVSGDLVKLIYAKNLHKSLTKSFLMTSALVDRIYGALALLLVSGVFNIIFYNELVSRSIELKSLIIINLTLLAIGLSIVFLVLTFSKQREFIVKALSKNRFLKPLNLFLDPLFEISKCKKTVFLCFAVSTSAIVCLVLSFWFLSVPFLKPDTSIAIGFSIIPLGYLVTALPLAPAGLGIGHVAFRSLFLLFGIENGASLFNLHFLIWISLYLLGIIPYLSASKKYSLKTNSV